MRNAATAGNRLLAKLSPKELVGMILQHEVDQVLEKPSAFTEHELIAAKGALQGREWDEYKAYIELLELMTLTQYEARIAALNVLWRLSASFPNMMRFREEKAEFLLSMQEDITRSLKQYYLFEAILQVIDETMGCTTAALIGHETERLIRMLAFYQDLTLDCDEALKFDACQRGEEINDDQRLFPELDIPALKPVPEVLEQIRQCFTKPKGRSIWDVVDVAREDLEI